MILLLDLIAFSYIGGVLKSYSEFRSTKRKQLEALELAMKNTSMSIQQHI